MIDPSRHRGQVWLAALRAPDRTRPVVLVSRDEAYPVRHLVTYAPVTNRDRGIPTQVAVRDAGLAGLSGVINCDLLATIEQDRLIEFIGPLPDWKIDELNDALRLSLGLD